MAVRVAAFFSLLVGSALIIVAGPTAPAGSSAKTWNFDSEKAEGPPAGFAFGRTGSGREGRWVVANALENNVRIYYVKEGNRRQFAGWNGKVTSGEWHDLRVDAKGDHFEVSYDGKKVIDATDKSFPDAGKIGLWTKADSVTYFDNLTVHPMDQP